jgi:hypothetical protein
MTLSGSIRLFEWQMPSLREGGLFPVEPFGKGTLWT